MRNKRPKVPMVRCPKCSAKGESVVLHEIWNGANLEFEQRADGTINPEGVVLGNMDPCGVSGLCLRCEHQWRLHEVAQIINLPGHPEYLKYRRLGSR